MYASFIKATRMPLGSNSRFTFPNILLFLAFLNLLFICYLMAGIIAGH